MPHVLTADQKQSRVDACLELKEHLEIDPDLFPKVITGDESWCYVYDPETKQQSSEWKSSNLPRPKKGRRIKSNVKTMLTSFLMQTALFTQNSFLTVKLLTRRFTYKF